VFKNKIANKLVMACPSRQNFPVTSLYDDRALYQKGPTLSQFLFNQTSTSLQPVRAERSPATTIPEAGERSILIAP